MLFLVNLDSATERRHRMAAQLAALGLSWQRVGYDGRRASGDSIRAHARHAVPALAFDDTVLSGAEIGCWLSHLGAWQRLIAHPHSRVGVVLEDDVLLDASLPAALADLAAPHPFDLVYLGTSSRNISTRRHMSVGRCVVHQPVGTILNTWGYVVGRGFIERFLATRQRIDLPIDRYLGNPRRTGARVGVLRPAVVREDPLLGLRSQIEPFTHRLDRSRLLDRARRRLLASRVSDAYYALYRWL